MNFIQALKISTTENKNAWCVNIKSTPQYEEVIKIMNSNKTEVLPKSSKSTNNLRYVKKVKKIYK